jgi:hypothetical protein
MTDFNETATAEAFETNAADVDYNHNDGTTGEVVGVVDVLDTPTLSLPPSAPEIHEGTITSVETKTFESGTVGVIINLVSKNTGQDVQHKIWPPAEFFEAAYWEGGKFNADALSDVPDPGKKQSARVKYARNIASTEGAATVEINGKEGEIQKLIKLAKLDGRTAAGTVTDGESYVAVVNNLVAGLEVLFTRTPDKSDDPQYAGRLRVGRIIGKDFLNDPKFDKSFPELTMFVGKSGAMETKGYRRAWAY